ncbi:profilin [Chaetomium fimeti]|jgi:profilin|uniref:Profilin n=1 Tax=Chaetomium fimeti TaxID=1854472 RepID=A0AAE0HED0_9PEZI|nr:profilin [Chaetomium fimeti]
MSWQAYVDTSLVGSGQVHKACIASLAGDSVWATSPEFAVTPDELKTIANIFKEGKEGETAMKVYAGGLNVAGERYVVPRIEDASAYARQGRTGVCISTTKQAIIITWHNDTGVAGNATQTTQKLADYLIGQGY